MKEHVWVKSRGGRLSVMIHTPDMHTDPKKPMVICCHGFTGEKIGYNQLTLNLAKAWEAAGFTVVRFDFLGSGDSDGDFSTDTLISGWRDDLENILTWLNENPQYQGTPKVLYGHSLGGLVVLMRKDSERDAYARIVFAPTIYPIETFKNITLGPDLWERSCAGEEISNFYGKGFSLKSQFVFDMLKENYDPLAAAQQLTMPILIVHGSKDTAVPIAGSEELYKIYGGEKEFVRLDSDHIATGRQTQLQEAVLKWMIKR